jgi:transposase
MSKRSRRRFSTEFKAETVRLFETSDKTMAAIARDLDVSISAVRSWVKQARIDNGQGQGEITTKEREELTRLRREIRVLKMEREILKKATAFFAKESR